MSSKVDAPPRNVNPTRQRGRLVGDFQSLLEDRQVALYPRVMTKSLDFALAPLATHVRNVAELPARYAEIEAAETHFKHLKKVLLQEVALGLRAEGKTWKEVGQIMGKVTYQRAFQIGHGE